MKSKRLLIMLIVSAFATVVCRCTGAEAATLRLSDGAILQCFKFGEYIAFEQPGIDRYSFDCKIPCPDGSAVSVEKLVNEYADSKNIKFDLPTLQLKYCPAVPPPPPLEKAPPIQADVPLPLLTGKITSCNYQAGFINFELADPARSLDQLHMQVAFNEDETVCNVPTTNADILTCTLPRGIRFPLNVLVQVDNVEVNDFSFDGSYCGYKDPGGSNDTDSGDEGGGSSDAPACDPHDEPNCPVDCTIPANADLCQ